MLKSPLYSKYIESNAKLVNFAGWEMPINYPAGIIKESSFVRESCGMFDVSHIGRIEISWKNVKRYIEKILPIDINAIKKSVFTVFNEILFTEISNPNNTVISFNIL